MQTYALDTSAVALVLYDKEFKSINLDASGVLRLTTEKQVRIKVLKEEGTSYVIHLTSDETRFGETLTKRGKNYCFKYRKYG